GRTDLLRRGANAEPQEVRVLPEYPAAPSPAERRPQAGVIPGPASVQIEEWLLPTLGQRPHDPLWAADGSLWWTGQWANVLGRLDPRTGQMKEFPLKTPDSGPHGLTADRARTISDTGT